MSSQHHEDITERNKQIAELLPACTTDESSWLQVKELHMENMADYVDLHNNFHAAVHEYELWKKHQPFNLVEALDEVDINGALFACSSYVQLVKFNDENYQKCLDLAGKMIKLYNDDPGISSLFLMMRGDAHQWSNNFEAAGEDFKAAQLKNSLLMSACEGDSPVSTSVEMTNAALCRRRFDNYLFQKAYDEALKVIDQDFGTAANSTEMLDLKGHMYLDLAYEYHMEAHEDLVDSDTEQALNSKSMETLQKALEAFNASNNDANCALAHQRMGNLYMCMREEEKAKQSLESALALHEISRDENWGESTMCLAMIHRALGEEGEFEKQFNLAEKRFEEFGSNEKYAQFLHEKAAYHWSHGDFEHASSYYNRSQDIYDFMLDPLSMDLPPHDEICENCKHSPELVEFFNKLQLERLEFQELDL